MVLLGGFTRLTGSGLSITEWKPVTGTIPPFSLKSWEFEFKKYKETPEFEFVNFNMEIGDFKRIYLIEYSHRLLGRLIFIIFIIPALYLLLKKNALAKNTSIAYISIFFIGLSQAFFGWYMVQSGLIDVPSVNHYRLSLHFMTAILIFCLLYNQLLNLYDISKYVYNDKKIFYWIITILFLVTIQSVYGTFVAGTKAGYIYNTFPLMSENAFIPEYTNNIKIPYDLFNDPGTIQFIHRLLGVAIVFSSFFVLYIIQKIMYKNFFYIFLFSIIVQFILGISTLLTKVNIFIALLHQSWLFLIISSAIFLIKCYKRK
ncbi:heme A synthase [Anaplasmataceae bacterium AB001_6]|nr:heme A synthase [Anaplasmataceae bacterium AB001_6]